MDDDDFKPVDASFIKIIGSSMMIPFDGVSSHFKPTQGKALPYHCNQVSVTSMLQFAGDLLSDSESESRSRDFDVIGFFLRGLVVTLLL